MANHTLPSGAILNYITPSSTNSNGIRGIDLKKPHQKNIVKQNTPEKEEADLLVLNTIVSCLDIISRQRIEQCVRSTRCDHIECFDFKSFCQVNNISDTYYERRKNQFTPRYEAIPVVNQVTSELIVTKNMLTRKTRSSKNNHNRKYVVKMTRKKKKGSKLFKIIQNGKTSSLAGRKLTGGHTQTDWMVRCPLCSVKFLPNELIHDDFMTTILKYVPKDVRSIEIGEDWVVSKVIEKSPFQNQEVVAIEDDETSDEENIETVKVSHSTRKKRDKGFFEWDSDDFDDLAQPVKINGHRSTGTTAYDPVVID